MTDFKITWKNRILDKKQFWSCLLNWDCAYRKNMEHKLDHTLNDILCAYQRHQDFKKLKRLFK